MLTLDCHDVERTYASLEAITGLKRSELDDFFDTCHPEQDGVPDPQRYADNVFERLKGSANINTEYDATCWFHFTRLPAGTEFDGGVRPLRDALPRLLRSLREMAGSCVDARLWADFESAVLRGDVRAGTLATRTDGYQQGPFGGLVRDFAFHASPKRDYLRRLPEAVEDLVGEIRTRFGVDMTDNYLNQSSSYIVKFRTAESREGDLAAALYYALTARRGEHLGDDCITYRSLEGVAVSPVHVMSVEEIRNPAPLKGALQQAAERSPLRGVGQPGYRAGRD